VLFEYLTGGGSWLAAGGAPASSALLVEGRAMIRAVAADFAALPDVEVWTSRDARIDAQHPSECTVATIDSEASLRQWLGQASAEADWTLLIAPESGGALAGLCRLVEAAGGKLLSPSSAVVEIAADKQATAELLASRGVSVPRGVIVSSPAELAAQSRLLPAVIKPRDGCGSQGVKVLHRAADLIAWQFDRPLRLEEYVFGLAASVAVLAGPQGLYSLPPCGQRLSQNGNFTYLGGRLPLSAGLATRARRLAEAAIAALPAPSGYLGVDLVLGAAADGSGDRVIEINPRLTTSYIGLRALAQSNLAAAMLAAAAGQAPDLRFGSQPIEFKSDGTIVSAARSA
jgi:predicted ATP-grasp superfamily ATP-dependent carboligase